VFPHGRVEVVELDDRVIGRSTYLPGWRWSVDVQPVAQTPMCEIHHVGTTISGHLRVQMADGTELELGPEEAFDVPPGHDAWVVGDEPWVGIQFEGTRTLGRDRADVGRRTLATILITDIVDSTQRAIDLGATAWHQLVSRHNEISESVVDAHGGRLVKTTGDGIICMFDSAELAVRAAPAVMERMTALDLVLRAAVNVGEVELTASDVRGVAVHAAARMMALAERGGIIVPATVRDLLEDSGLDFEDLGQHSLKGLPGKRQLFRLISPD
jgi:class 3 adenylate cyclase